MKSVVISVVVVVCILFILILCCLGKKRIMRSSRCSRESPQDAFGGRTPQYQIPLREIKVIAVLGKNEVNITLQQLHPENTPESVPRLPTSQHVLDTGVDSSSGFQLASQQPSPPPRSVCMPLPTSQPLHNSGDYSSSGFPAKQRPSTPPQPVFSSGENSSSGFLRSQQPLPPPPDKFSLVMSNRFTYEELKEATNGFSQTNLIGSGGFANVYKGTLSGDKHIAVKQLNSCGSDVEGNFEAEVKIISSVRHRHLVSFLGYCIHHNQRLLVCEFVSNNTLKYHLHGKKSVGSKFSVILFSLCI